MVFWGASLLGLVLLLLLVLGDGDRPPPIDGSDQPRPDLVPFVFSVTSAGAQGWTWAIYATHNVLDVDAWDYVTHGWATTEAGAYSEAVRYAQTSGTSPIVRVPDWTKPNGWGESGGGEPG